MCKFEYAWPSAQDNRLDLPIYLFDKVANTLLKSLLAIKEHRACCETAHEHSYLTWHRVLRCLRQTLAHERDDYHRIFSQDTPIRRRCNAAHHHFLYESTYCPLAHPCSTEVPKPIT